jgi:predicted tellurium resistance membrane protein TerC
MWEIEHYDFERMDLDSSSILMAGVVDLALSADNAIVIRMAVSSLEATKRAKAIFWGTSFAVALRIGLAAGATQLLDLPGIRVVGSVLLVWVCIRLGQDLFGQRFGDLDQRQSAHSESNLRRTMIKYYRSGCVDVAGQCTGNRRDFGRQSHHLGVRSVVSCADGNRSYSSSEVDE